MLKKHLVVLLLMVMAVGVYAQSIPSGTGRYEALGSSPYILDAATDVYNNPVWSSYYRNYAFGDIGRNVVNDFQLSDQYAGASFGVSKKWSLGLILNKRSDDWNDFNTAGNTDSIGVKQPIVPTMLLISYMAGKDFYIGLAPYIAMWSSEQISGTDSDKKSANSFGASLGIMKSMKKWWIEGVVDFRMNSYKRDLVSSGTTSNWKSEGGIQLGVALRGWIYPKSSSKIAIVPVLGFHTYSWNPLTTIAGTSTTGTKYSEMAFNGGVGLNWPISDDIQIAGGIGAMYQTYKGETTPTGGTTTTAKNTDFIAPQFNFAGETRIADWLTGRFGYSRAIDMSKFEVTSSTGTGSYSETYPSNDVNTVSLGTGFHFGRFSIDATVSEKWLKEGINFVSGKQNDVFGVVSASYNFASGK